MPMTLSSPIIAAYDTVGAYNQDAINGFSDDFLDAMLSLVAPHGDCAILDAMAGNGNLTLRLYEYCQRNAIDFPHITMLEFSKIQCDMATVQLLDTPTQVVWGDVLTMDNFTTGETLPDQTFDRVMIKSGSHEISLEEQLQLYTSVFRVLKPGGLFVNLGFLFDEQDERDQFRDITRFKDQAAGLQSAVENRHFLTRDELYTRLEQAGFVDVRCGRHFEYRIDSSVAAKEYFPETKRDDLHAELQAQQARALVLRRRGRIQFHGDSSTMMCPGEITITRRPL